MGYAPAELFIAEGAKIFIVVANAAALKAAKQALVWDASPAIDGGRSFR